MGNFETRKARDYGAFWILIGIPIISVVGTILHFVYDWSGESVIVGIFAPVNESIWEHQKLIFWPTIAWWLIGYFNIIKNGSKSAAQWFFSCSACVYVGPLFIISFYYTYTGAFGIQSVLLLDILSFFVAVTVAQFLGFHFYRYANTNRSDLIWSIIAILILMGAMILFTFNPPQLPIFVDPITGLYGI